MPVDIREPVMAGSVTNFRLGIMKKKRLQHMAVDVGITLSEALRRVVAAFLAMSEEEQQEILRAILDKKNSPVE